MGAAVLLLFFGVTGQTGATTTANQPDPLACLAARSGPDPLACTVGRTGPDPLKATAVRI